MKRITTILLAALVVASAIPAPASASHEDETESILNDVVSSDGDRLDSLMGAATGLYQRTQHFFAARGDDESPGQHADNLKATFNANSASIETYVNERTDASTESDVLELTLTESDEGSATVYLVADVNGTNYENASVVESTDRTPDEECTLEGAAARNADDELDTFVSTYAATGDDASKRYKSKLAAEYAGQISCSFL